MSERPYFSIGEVLGLLLEEFSDVTISKIRFLESQGLIDPERTASGYRKFYDADIERLRYILREQKDHYLPLKVIKERLDGIDHTLPNPPRPIPGGASWAFEPDGAASTAHLRADDVAEPEAPAEHHVVQTTTLTVEHVVVTDPGTEHAVVVDDVRTETITTDQVVGADEVAPVPAAAAVMTNGAAPVAAARPEAVTPTEPVAPPTPAAPPHETPRARPEPPAAPTATPSAPPAATPEPTAPTAPTAPIPPAAPAAVHPPVLSVVRDPLPADLQLTAAELCERAGIEPPILRQLQEYGLVLGRALGTDTTFGADALQIATLARRFLALGLEVRHLRTWRMAAEKEASLFEQLVLPLIRQRNPQSRAHAVETLRELTELGGDLRVLLVHAALGEYFDR